jgi:carbonic anhydrase
MLAGAIAPRQISRQSNAPGSGADAVGTYLFRQPRTAELLFADLTLGELFVARDAGNIVDTDTMGTIEYGAEHLGIPFVVVLGHERCGALTAACAVVEKHEKFPGSIGPMVNAIVPAATAVYGKPGDFVDNTVRESVKRTAMTIATKSAMASHLIKAHKIKVPGARYHLDSGRVEFLTP